MIIVGNNLISFIFRWLWSRQINNQRSIRNRCICFFCLGFSIKSTKKMHIMVLHYHKFPLSHAQTRAHTRRQKFISKGKNCLSLLLSIYWLICDINVHHSAPTWKTFHTFLLIFESTIMDIARIVALSVFSKFVCFPSLDIFRISYVFFFFYTNSFLCVYSFKRMNIFFQFPSYLELPFLQSLFWFFKNLFQHFYLFLIYSRSFCNLLSNFFDISLFLIFHTCKT